MMFTKKFLKINKYLKQINLTRSMAGYKASLYYVIRLVIMT